MTCLCKYLTPERMAAGGVEVRDVVCVACSKAGLSFPPERKPDLRRGLCIEEGCENTDRNGWGGRCYAHAYLHDVARRSA